MGDKELIKLREELSTELIEEMREWVVGNSAYIREKIDEEERCKRIIPSCQKYCRECEEALKKREKEIKDTNKILFNIKL